MNAKLNLATEPQFECLLFCFLALGGCGAVSDSSDSSSANSQPATAVYNPMPISDKLSTISLAMKYPGDVGIGKDSATVWHEDFQEGSLAAVVGRYDSYSSGAGMTLVGDHPKASSGALALALSAGGGNSAAYLYKSFGAGFDELYFRYYAKYVGDGPWHHTGLWVGGYNPPLPYTYPRAGRKPTGSNLFSIGLEPIPVFTNLPMDFYTYWRGMNSWKPEPTGAVGDYYGNTLLHDAKFRMQSNSWVCYEIHLKVNPDPVSSAGAVLEVWQNDQLIRRFDDNGPRGYWIRDKFCALDASGSECTTYRPANPTPVLLDQQWRSAGALKVNYFWPQNYNTEDRNSTLMLADMVVATQRVGCTIPR